MIITIILTLVGVSMVSTYLSKLTNRVLLQDQYTEIFWTVAPVFILLSIGVPSIQALYLLDDPFRAPLTVKVVGHQWYWSYELSNVNSKEFTSYIVPQPDTNVTRLLEVDNSLVLPSNSPSRIVVTRTDVIHAWTIPSIGVKVDAVPGRLNQLIFTPNRTGVFFGQCSEICGANHSFIPIKLEVVPINVFEEWLSNYKI